MENYSVIYLLSMMFLIGCLLHLHENDVFRTEIVKRFRLLIYVLMLETTVDLVFALFEGSKIDKDYLYLLKSFELSLNPVVVLLVFNIFYDAKALRRNRTANGIRNAIIMSIILNCFIIIANAIGKFIFYIDKDNRYKRGELVYLHVLIIVTIICLLMYGIHLHSNRTQSTMKTTLLSFMLILDVGIVLRAAFMHSNYDFLCMSVSVTFLLLYYSHTSLRVDPVTQLLNRQVYQKAVETIDYTTIAIVIDANNFKLINDTYGHEAGDRALKQLANAICQAYGKYAYCFRTGGDEFCAILKEGSFDKLIDETPNCDAYSMAEQFMKRLDTAILEQIKETNDASLQYGVSQGYGIYYSDKNYPNNRENMSLKKVVKLADKRMYRNKGLLKENGINPENIHEHDLGRARVIYEPSIAQLVDEPSETQPDIMNQP